MNKIIVPAFLAMLLTTPASAEFFSKYGTGGSSQAVAVGSVEVKGRGVVNLVAVLEFVRTPKDSKIYKSDAYEEFLDRVIVGAKSIVLKLLLEKSAIDPSELKTIRETIEKTVSHYFEVEAQKTFPSEKVFVNYGLTMLYISDPFEDGD